MRDGCLRHAVRATQIALLALAASGCVSLSLLPGPPQPLRETVIYGEAGPKILMLDIRGLITNDPRRDTGLLGPERESMLARLREELEQARKDSQIRALLLRIDSPGGEATASDLIYAEILRFKRERGVPVVAQILGSGTSGGYYVAMAADRVLAHPTSVTGSIGVIFLGVNLAGLMEKLGIEDQTLTAGEHKDAGSPLRRMTPGERAHIQTVLDELHARFRAVVLEGRPGLDSEAVEALADGSIYGAERAREAGLIDEIGDLRDAVAEAERAAGLEASRVVTYHRPREYRQNLYTRPTPPDTLRLELLPWLSSLPRPGFLYLWAPGAF